MPDPASTESTIQQAVDTEKTPDMTTTFSDAVSALMRGELNEASSSLLLKVIVPAGIALIMLIVTYFVAKLISRWVAAALCRRVDETLGRFAGKLTYYTILIVAGLSILQTLDVGITSIAAIMAATGFAIGLAFQGTLSNFASGVLLMVFRPFRVGDVINAAGVLGKVNEIDLFTTTMDTPDNRRLIVPNSSISGATIENVTYHSHRRVDVEIGVGYAAGLDDTRSVLTNCAESLAEFMVTGKDRGYQVLLSNLGASSVDWTIRFWTKTEDYFTVKETLTAAIKRQLDECGIEIPFPQMQLHVTEPILNTSSTTIDEPILPIPKMNVSAENRSGKIRPRARDSR